MVPLWKSILQPLERITISHCFCASILQWIFSTVSGIFKGLGEGKETISPEVTDIKRIPKVIVSVETTKMYLKEQFQAAIEARNSVSNDRYGSVIQSAKEYIEKNFSNGELSLNRIAAYIGVSPSYFSSIFKQEQGQPL